MMQNGVSSTWYHLGRSSSRVRRRRRTLSARAAAPHLSGTPPPLRPSLLAPPPPRVAPLPPLPCPRHLPRPCRSTPPPHPRFPPVSCRRRPATAAFLHRSRCPPAAAASTRCCRPLLLPPPKPNPSRRPSPVRRHVLAIIPGSSTTHSSNPFAGPEPSAAAIRDLNIEARVPIRLDSSSTSYYAWKTYFKLIFREYYLTEHIDGSVDSEYIRGDPEWSANEATIIRWFYQMVSKDIFHTVVTEEDDGCTVWAKINAFFTDNKLQRLVFLQQEFFGCHQDNSTIDKYCIRLKMLADELRDIGAKVSDDLMLSNLTAGLKEDFGNAASNLTLLSQPSFQRVVAYLKLEERRMTKLKQRVQHTALATGTTRGSPAPPPTLRRPTPPAPTGYYLLPPAPPAPPAPP
nr:uncharacterized protein LOC109752030 [Aegilops tauschii subsp. strangulata]